MTEAQIKHFNNFIEKNYRNKNYLSVISKAKNFLEKVPNHIDVEINLANIYALVAWSYFRIGQYKEAENYFRLAAKDNEKLFGKNSPQTAISYNNLARYLLYMAKVQHMELTDEPLQITQECIEINSKIPSAWKELENNYRTLARYYTLKGDDTNATKYLNKSNLLFNATNPSEGNDEKSENDKQSSSNS